MKELSDRLIDDTGTVVFTEEGLVNVLMSGGSVAHLTVEPSETLQQFNSLCEQWDMLDDVVKLYEPFKGNVDAFHRAKRSTWFMPDYYKELDVQDYLLMKCHLTEEVVRVLYEYEMFQERDLVPVLQFLIYLVDYLRDHKILWGIGRGSSVASYCLYLIGIHRINSLTFKLDIHEFLK